MPNRVRTGNVTTFVDKISGFERRGSLVYYWSEQNGEAERRCIPISALRETAREMATFIADNPSGGTVIPLPPRK